MNKDIYDMRFDGSEEDLKLQDFISRAEPVNCSNERLTARIYEKIQADKICHNRKRWRIVAAVAVTLMTCSMWLALNIAQKQLVTTPQPTAHTQVQTSVMQEINVPTGHTLQLTLPDGTRLTANSRTQIRYAKPFDKHTRHLYLKGEAYFEVAHEANRPFVVHAQGFDVKVLGTHFCVNSYNKKRCNVVLAEGRVEVNTALNDKVNLQPNDCLNITQGEFASKTKVNATAYVDRLKGVLPMEGMPLTDVVNYLENYYGVNFQVESSLCNETLYGKLVTGAPLADVLTSLCNISGAVAEVKKGVVTIKKKSTAKAPTTHQTTNTQL